MRALTALLAVALFVLPSVARAADPAEDENKWTTTSKVEGGYERGAMYGRGMNGGRLRLGLGRQNDDVGFALSFGLGGRLGVDVVKFGERNRDAVTLDGRLDAHLFLTGYYASAGIYVGVRF